MGLRFAPSHIFINHFFSCTCVWFKLIRCINVVPFFWVLFSLCWAVVNVSTGANPFSADQDRCCWPQHLLFPDRSSQWMYSDKVSLVSSEFDFVLAVVFIKNHLLAVDIYTLPCDMYCTFIFLPSGRDMFPLQMKNYFKACFIQLIFLFPAL